MASTIMSDFAKQQYALHHRVSMWCSARMCVSPHIKLTLCASVHSVVCVCVCVWVHGHFEVVFMLNCD